MKDASSDRLPPPDSGSIHPAVRAPLAVLLAFCAIGCGPDDASSSTIGAGTHAFESGATITVEPGANRPPSNGTPTLWASIPTPTISVESSRRNKSAERVRLANIAPSSDLSIQTARYQSADDREGCGDDRSGSVDCTAESDPLCEAAELSHEPGAASEGELTLELPPCTQLELALEVVVDRSNPMSIAAIGSGASAESVGSLVDAAASDAQFVLLTGDHTADSTEGALDDLAEELRGRQAPVVFTPGEAETIGDSRTAFHRRFGPPRLGFEFGSVQFLTFDSARQTLGTDGVGDLRSHLRELDPGEPIVALTHTPPFDPKELRKRGFRSETEAARTISSLSDYRTDLLVAGHLPERHRRDDAGFLVAIPPPGDGGGYHAFDLTTRPAGANSKLDVDVTKATR